MAHIGAVPCDVDVEVFFGGLQVDGVVKVHAFVVLQRPVPPHQIGAGCRHGEHH